MRSRRRYQLTARMAAGIPLTVAPWLKQRNYASSKSGGQADADIICSVVVITAIPDDCCRIYGDYRHQR